MIYKEHYALDYNNMYVMMGLLFCSTVISRYFQKFELLRYCRVNNQILNDSE